MSFQSAHLFVFPAGREGPSTSLGHEMLKIMVHFTIQTFFPDIWASHGGDTLEGDSPDVQAMYLDWFKEVMEDTKSLLNSLPFNFPS